MKEKEGGGSKQIRGRILKRANGPLLLGTASKANWWKGGFDVMPQLCGGTGNGRSSQEGETAGDDLAKA
jgi:hypothetical protein